MLEGIKQNITAGFSVFLLALPLCLGIAVASDFPAVSGILSAIIGGIVASCLGGAQLSIKGPAAGLIVIALSAVTELGYERTLAVGVIAAIMQILMGVTRKAIIAEVISPSVIHGMLVAIGIIIVSQQVYVMMGLTPEAIGAIPLLFEFPQKIIAANPIILLFALISLFITLLWPLLKKISVIPSTIIILLIVIPLALFLDISHEHHYYFLGHEYHLGSQFLIAIPDNIFQALTFPDFSMIFSITSLKYIIMFTLVGSIESLLTVCAIDTINPKQTPSDLNKDLRAVGIGNLVSAFIGGLPMISEIVRSKANIDYGATSALSNFSHGLFMLIAVLLIPNILSLIPLSALAAILVVVGLRLASPKEFIHVYHVGKDQFLLFMVTLLITLMVDLLIGIMAGLLLKIILHIARGNSLMQLFKPSIKIEKTPRAIYLHAEGALTFLNYLQLKKAIHQAKHEGLPIIIDLDAVNFIDHTVLNKFQTLQHEFGNIKISVQENQQLAHYYNHPLATSKKVLKTTKDIK